MKKLFYFMCAAMLAVGFLSCKEVPVNEHPAVMVGDRAIHAFSYEGYAEMLPHSTEKCAKRIRCSMRREEGMAYIEKMQGLIKTFKVSAKLDPEKTVIEKDKAHLHYNMVLPLNLAIVSTTTMELLKVDGEWLVDEYEIKMGN